MIISYILFMGGILMIMNLQGQLTILKSMNIKPNFSELAREYDLDRRTVKKYYEGYEGKSKTRNKSSRLDQYYIEIKEKLAINGVTINGVYQYFKDKHDILIAGIQKYASDIFYPMLNTVTTEVDLSPQNFRDVLKNMTNRFIENHKLSQSAHQEIMAMTHSDEDIAHFFQEHDRPGRNGIPHSLSVIQHSQIASRQLRNHHFPIRSQFINARNH